MSAEGRRSRDTVQGEPDRWADHLPINEIKLAFLAALSARRRVVVTAPTGSGKSTRIPLWCNQGGARVLVVEPRRIACRTLARYVAKQTGSPLGGRVGYSVRHDKRFSAESGVVYATPGTVLRMLHAADAGSTPVR